MPITIKATNKILINPELESEFVPILLTDTLLTGSEEVFVFKEEFVFEFSVFIPPKN